jgi:site-specific recombinase XerD
MSNSVILRDSGLDLGAIDRANLQPSTKAKYKREIESMMLAGVNPLNYEVLQAYADSLKSSRKSFLKSALRMMSMAEEQRIKSKASPENVATAQAAIMRLEAMHDAVTVATPKGTKAHTWLSQMQVTEITAFCDLETLEGKRDWIVLGLLLGAGLRRDELSELTFDALKQQPMKRGKMRDVLQVKGKGAKDRVIPISDKLARHLREWKEIIDGGKVARALGMKKELADNMSSVSIFKLVSRYGAQIGIPELAPHDLRRTYAQLGYEAGVPITQISTLLGHADIRTTQKYLDLSTDLETTASDFIPLSG